MKLTPLQKRAERRSRHGSMVDMNLVSLIDVFTILIFFLLSNATGVDILPSPKAVQLPQSVAQKSPKRNLVVVVSGAEITVDGQRVAAVGEVLAMPGEMIAPLQAALRQHGAAGDHSVTIMGDKDIPYQLLRKVMFTAARADFVDVSFAVRSREL